MMKGKRRRIQGFWVMLIVLIVIAAIYLAYVTNGGIRFPGISASAIMV